MNTAMMLDGKKIQVGLDRTVIGLKYPSFPKTDGTPLPKDQIELIHEMQKEFKAKMYHIKSTVTSGPHHCKGKKKDLKRYYVQSETDGTHLCTFALGYSYGTTVINFEFNPSKLSPEQFGEIGALMMVLFNDHYQEVYGRGVVAHAEFFIDVPEAVLSDLVLVDLGRRTTTPFKGTTYSGKQSSRLVGTMYDKGKESKTAGKLVRIELRINRRDIPFKDLVEQDQFNPFSSFLVVEASQLQLVAQEWKSPHLANNIKEHGLYGGVATSYARKKIGAYLKEHTVPWWQPDVLWAGHRELLLKLKPGPTGVFAY